MINVHILHHVLFNVLTILGCVIQNTNRNGMSYRVWPTNASTNTLSHFVEATRRDHTPTIRHNRHIFHGPNSITHAHTHTHTHTHTCFMALWILSRITRYQKQTHTQPFYCSSEVCPGPPGWAGTRKVKPGRLKPIWIYWSKRSEWQWHLLGYMQVCISSQTATPTSHHSVLALPDAQPTASKHWRQYPVPER